MLNDSLNIHQKSNEEKDEKDKNNKNKLEIINWKEQCMNGNLMPGIIMLENKKINVDDEINQENGNTLLHYAALYGYFNVIRALIEVYHANINKINKSGYSPFFFIVSNNNANIFNFYYFIKLKNINFYLKDKNGLNILMHSIIANFHYAFLFFSYESFIDKFQNEDKFSLNPLIYFTIINNNKFALSYLLVKKRSNINSGFYNNSVNLSDILITSKYSSITKFLIKYFNEEINLNSIHSCKKKILNFHLYNLLNYELLNTLYFYKTKSYFSFLLSLLYIFKVKISNNNSHNQNQMLLEENLPNNEISYKYRIINLKYMIYDLVLPNIPKKIKMISYLIYLCIIYFGTKNQIKVNIFNEYSLIYKIFSFILLYILFIWMFFSNDKILHNYKEIESEIFNKINNGNLIDLPTINELCPACGTRKNISDSHCFRCKDCFPNRFFHSNLFQICITKYNIKRYLFFILLKINFYFICLYNCLDNNPTNKSIFAFFYIFRYKTGLFNALSELIIGFLIFKDIGHFISMIFSLLVKTPYQFIYKYHKKVYPYTLKEKEPNHMILQSPEINEVIPFKSGIINLLNNIC